MHCSRSYLNTVAHVIAMQWHDVFKESSFTLWNSAKQTRRDSTGSPDSLKEKNLRFNLEEFQVKIPTGEKLVRTIKLQNVGQEKLKDIDEEKLNSEEKEALDAFQDALEKREKGITDDW